jgi:hypothetical protein
MQVHKKNVSKRLPRIDTWPIDGLWGLLDLHMSLRAY